MRSGIPTQWITIGEMAGSWAQKDVPYQLPNPLSGNVPVTDFWVYAQCVR
jgi:hypothetical protein